MLFISQVTPTTIIEAAKEGGTFGAQILLFLGLIVLGIVIVSLDKRRETARELEREDAKDTREKEIAAIEKRYQETLKHHEDFVAFVRQERDATERDRTTNQNVLIGLITESTKQSAATQAALLSLERFLKDNTK